MNIMSILGLDIGDVGGIVNNALRALTAWLCELIYPGIKLMYEVFSEMGQLAFSDSFNEIYKKISLVLGIFMIFRITFWLIELMLSPEKLTDKEKNPGKILIKVLTVVVLLATTPTIFQYAMNIQQKVLESQIIERVINITNEETMDISTSGGYLAANLFNNFYTKGEYTDENDDCVEFYVGTNGSIAEALRSGNKVSIGNSCLYKTIDKVEGGEEIEPYVIDFNGLFAVAVGGFTFWMILMYCISVGTRYIQLVFLQVIAPIPIMCYIAPGKDNMFQKWLKQCTTTYLDVFIRVAIINFVILLSRLIFANDNNIILSTLNSSASWVIQVLLVLGLLTFAKKAPDLIQELLPKSVTKASGDFGLNWRKRTESMLGGKMIYGATTGAPKKAIGFMATVPNTLKNAAVRAYGAHKFNQRQDDKINQNYRNKRLDVYKDARNRVLANQNLTETQKKKGVAAIDKKIKELESKSTGQLRRDLAKQNKNLKAALNRTDNPEVQAKLMERIDENRASGMGHRNQAVTLATSLVGGTTKAFSAAMTGKNVGEIVRRANENQVKQITRELGWYQDNGYSFSQVAQRTISEVQRRFGIETQGQAVKYIIDSMDSDIKSQEEGVSKAKEIQQAYGSAKSSVKNIETEGEADVNKNEAVQVYNSATGKLESRTFSTNLGEMNASLERMTETFNNLPQTSTMKSVQSGRVIRDAVGNIISSPSDQEAATLYQRAENLIDNISKNCSLDPGKQESVRTELTRLLEGSDNFENAFNSLITAAKQKISESKSDYGKQQGTIGAINYMLLQNEKNKEAFKAKGIEVDDVYTNQTIGNELEFIFREVNTNSGRYSTEILETVRALENISNSSVEEATTPESIRVFQKDISSLKKAFDKAQSEQSIVVSNLTDELQATKHQNTAFKNYTGTTDKINADKYEGPHGGPHGGHH